LPAVPSLTSPLISDFDVPLFLLPIYQAAAARYGVPWEVLAAINEIESDYGRDVAVSSAGAVGWMQFLPSTWALYGVDANHDGRRDPDNPADAIFAAARYLRAAGAEHDLRAAIFAYNHAGWYVNAVLSRAQTMGALPTGVVRSLSGLAQGRFPVLGRTRYAARAAAAGRRARPIRIFGRPGVSVVAVNAGRVTRVGRSARLGRYLRLRDIHGNTYTYARLHDVAARGARVAAGAVIGHVGTLRRHPGDYILFEIRPAGRAMPRIDAGPMLDAWMLLRSIGNYRGATGRAIPGRERAQAAVAGMFASSKRALAARVLADRRIQIYDCGRQDIRSGAIDRRVLVALEFLADSGLNPTVSALKCGHSLMTSSGNVSEHSTGDAVDIAAINGIPIAGHQGPGTITERAVRRLLTLRGVMRPHQIITLMNFPGASNTLAMPDHADHIHVGWRPLQGDVPSLPEADAGLRRRQWRQLVDRLGTIDNPTLHRAPSRYVLRATGNRRGGA
jgi:hypothetical protein